MVHQAFNFDFTVQLKQWLLVWDFCFNILCLLCDIISPSQLMFTGTPTLMLREQPMFHASQYSPYHTEMLSISWVSWVTLVPQRTGLADWRWSTRFYNPSKIPSMWACVNIDRLQSGIIFAYAQSVGSSFGYPAFLKRMCACSKMSQCTDKIVTHSDSMPIEHFVARENSFLTWVPLLSAAMIRAVHFPPFKNCRLS